MLLAPMTGVTDLPFRRLVSRLGAPLRRHRDGGVRSARARAAGCGAARGGGRGPAPDAKSSSWVGRQRPWPPGFGLAEGRRRRDHRHQHGLPCAREVTGGLSGSALLRDLDHAEGRW